MASLRTTTFLGTICEWQATYLTKYEQPFLYVCNVLLCISEFLAAISLDFCLQ